MENLREDSGLIRDRARVTLVKRNVLDVMARIMNPVIVFIKTNNVLTVRLEMDHCKKACRQVEVHNVNTQGEELVATLEVNNVSKAGVIVVEPSIFGTPIYMELDTGAAVTVMSHRNFNINFPDKANLLSASDLRLRTCSGELLKPVGVIRVPVTYKEQSKELDLYVSLMEDQHCLDVTGYNIYRWLAIYQICVCGNGQGF